MSQRPPATVVVPLALIAAALLAAPARADDLLIIDVDRVKLCDTDTGVVVDVAPIETGVQGMAICPSGRILVGQGNALRELDPVTYELTDVLSPGFPIRGVACAPDGTGYLIRAGPGGSTQPEWLYRFDAETGADLELVGITTNFSLQSLAADADGLLWSWSVSGFEAGLHTIDPATAINTHIITNPTSFDLHPQWLDFDSSGQLWGGRWTISTIDPVTAELTLLTDDVDDVRGAAFLNAAGPECFLVMGEAPGVAPFQWGPVGHAFTTQVGDLAAWHPVLMEDIPEFVIEDLLLAGAAGTRVGVAGSAGGASGPTGGPATGASLDDDPAKGHAEPAALAPVEFAVQVLMWNPQVFPSLPEQYTHGLAVRLHANGRGFTVPYGTSVGGMTVWAEIDVNSAGQRVIRFPFDIPLM